MLVFLLLVGGLAWLLSRARRTARQAAAAGPVLTDETVTAAQLRARAEAALAEGRHAAALVDGFRALAVRQVERGPARRPPRRDGARGRGRPGDGVPRAARSGSTAAPLLFDEVLYGDRPATREQATVVLALDDELAVRR